MSKVYAVSRTKREIHFLCSETRRDQHYQRHRENEREVEIPSPSFPNVASTRLDKLVRIPQHHLFQLLADSHEKVHQMA